MNEKTKYYFLVLICSLFWACEEITDWEFKTGENAVLVVEAIITDEFKIQEVFLSLSYDEINGKPSPVSDAEVVIKSPTESWFFSEDPQIIGRYTSDKAFSAILNTEYILEIKYKNELYFATNNMVQVIPFSPLSFKKFEDTDSLSFDNIPPAYSPHEQAFYEINVDWSHIFPSDTSRLKLFYYTFSTIDVNEIFKPGKQSVSFPKGSIVIEKKYSLNKKSAEYFRALAMETEWQGAAFDEASGPIPSNISNGGLGFFCVCAALSDTLIAQ